MFSMVFVDFNYLCLFSFSYILFFFLTGQETTATACRYIHQLLCGLHLGEKHPLSRKRKEKQQIDKVHVYARLPAQLATHSLWL